MVHVISIFDRDILVLNPGIPLIKFPIDRYLHIHNYGADHIFPFQTLAYYRSLLASLSVVSFDQTAMIVTRYNISLFYLYIVYLIFSYASVLISKSHLRLMLTRLTQDRKLKSTQRNYLNSEQQKQKRNGNGN